MADGPRGGACCGERRFLVRDELRHGPWWHEVGVSGVAPLQVFLSSRRDAAGPSEHSI